MGLAKRTGGKALNIEVTKQTRFVLAGVLVGSLIGALGAMFLFRQKGGQGRQPGQVEVASIERLSPQRTAALLWHTINVIREIVDFGADK